MKNIKRVILLGIGLFIISSIIILLFGKTYKIVYQINNKENNYSLNIDNATGEIEVLEEKLIKDKYIVNVKAKKPGKVFLYFTDAYFQSGSILYIHKTFVITDNTYLGKSTGSEVIPISISILLIYILYLLFKKYISSLKYNIYQYKNIAYLGIIIFLLFFLINNIISIFNYQGVFDTVNKTINSTVGLSSILFPIVIITFILVTISNINLMIKEGISLRNLLGLLLGILMCILTLLPDFVYRLLLRYQLINIYNLNSIGPYIYNFCEALVYLVLAYVECILIATIIVAIISVKKKIDKNIDYIIILGCQIRKDGTLPPLLKGRVDRAIDFRNEQLKETGKDLVFVPSGGQGMDEIIPEGEAIKNYLLEQGIDKKNILVEDKSTNTYENIKYSYKLINNKKANIVFSTTNYHVLRAGLTATEQGLKLEGIGSKTKSYFWINAFVREFIGTLNIEKKKHILFFLVLVIILIIMIGITYIGNNI